MYNVKVFNMDDEEAIKAKANEFEVGLFDSYRVIEGRGYVIGSDGYGFMEIRRDDGSYLTSMGWQTEEDYNKTNYDDKGNYIGNNKREYSFKEPVHWYQNPDGTDKTLEEVEEIKDQINQELATFILFFDDKLAGLF